MMDNIWKNGILGVVVGDALGCPVQFEDREDVARHPVMDMRGYGTFNLPRGSWTDDSSLTIALLESINRNGGVDLNDIMHNFVRWLDNGEFTPYGYSYDIGNGTMQAIKAYKRNNNPMTCGGTSERNNGNGSLMRILPVCLYCYEKGLSDGASVMLVHSVSALTHAHIRSKIACSLYYFMVKGILDGEGTLFNRLQNALDNGFEYHDAHFSEDEVSHFNRIRYLKLFSEIEQKYIYSSGYVVDTLEASVWSLLNTDSYRHALLKAVNLGLDTDTVGAVTGGLCGLYYGIGGNGIPKAWIDALKKVEMIEDMCNIADERMKRSVRK